jgi:hypothetical protein
VTEEYSDDDDDSSHDINPNDISVCLLCGEFGMGSELCYRHFQSSRWTLSESTHALLVS